MASGIGYKMAGVLGDLVATLGLIAPSLIIILIIAYCLKAFKENKLVNNAFYGLRPASLGLIAASGLTVMFATFIDVNRYRGCHSLYYLFNWKCIFLAIVIYALTHIKKIKDLHPIYFILFSAVVGILFNF